MLQTFNYRYNLGMPVKICMACAEELKSDREKEYGLCEKHRSRIIRPPSEVRRQFGRGTEYQLLRHTDELDDIIYKLEYNEEAGIYDGGRVNQRPEYLIFAHYIAKIFLERLQNCLALSQFDYITFADSCYVSMPVIFAEMGYLSTDKDQSGLFLQGQLQDRMREQNNACKVHNKSVLLLDLYRNIDTRKGIDGLRLAGAGEVVTGYLTSFS